MTPHSRNVRQTFIFTAAIQSNLNAILFERAILYHKASMPMTQKNNFHLEWSAVSIVSKTLKINNFHGFFAVRQHQKCIFSLSPSEFDCSLNYKLFFCLNINLGMRRTKNKFVLINNQNETKKKHRIQRIQTRRVT